MINRKTLVIFIIIGVPIDLLSELSIGIVTDSEKFPAARPNTCHWRPYSFKDFLAFSYQIHQHRDNWWKYFQFLDFRECATRQNVFFLPIFFRIMISGLVVYLMMHVLLYFWYNFLVQCWWHPSTISVLLWPKVWLKILRSLVSSRIMAENPDILMASLILSACTVCNILLFQQFETKRHYPVFHIFSLFQIRPIVKLM